MAKSAEIAAATAPALTRALEQSANRVAELDVAIVTAAAAAKAAAAASAAAAAAMVTARNYALEEAARRNATRRSC